MSTSRSLSFFRDNVNGWPQQSQNSNPLNRFSLSIRAGQRCSARIFAPPERTNRPGRMKQPLRKSTLCPKLAYRIWRADANFLLATESKMCYNIPEKISTATATPEKPGSTTYRADITILPSVDSSMRIPSQALVRGSWVTICLRIVSTILSAILIRLVRCQSV